MTLNPWTDYSRPFSLKAKVSVQNERAYCSTCSFLVAGGAGGASFYSNKYITLFTFLGVRGLYNDQIYAQYELIPELASKISLEFASIGLSAKRHMNKDSNINYNNYHIEARYHIDNSHSFVLDHNLLVKDEREIATTNVKYLVNY